MTAPGTEVEVLLVGKIAVQSDTRRFTLVELPTGEVASIPTGAPDAFIRPLTTTRPSTADIIEQHQMASLIPAWRNRGIHGADNWDAECACGTKRTVSTPDAANRWHAEHIAAALAEARRA